MRLPGYKDFVMEGNRRSTGKLVAVLNQVRADGLVQKSVRPEAGQKPRVMTGELDAAIRRASEGLDEGKESLMLARKHPGVSQIRLAMGNANQDPWKTIEKADAQRSAFLMSLAEAVELGKRKLFDTAVHGALDS